MKKSTFQLTVLIVTLTCLVVLVGIQINWILKAAKMQEAQFNHSVTMAMNRIVENLAREKAICREVTNCMREGDAGSCYLMMKNREEWTNIGSMIKNDLKFYGISLDFEFDIIDSKLDKNIHTNKSVYFSDDLVNALQRTGFELRIKFPEKRDFIIAQIGKFEFDSKNQLLIFGNKERRLTLKESRILRLLSNSKNNLVKREEIMIDAWGESDYYTGRSLDVFISKLRSYLKSDPAIWITTIPTVGYILEAKEDPLPLRGIPLMGD